jgi:hypothetical protein
MSEPVKYDRIARYVRACADRLELRDWRFTVAHEPPASPRHAASISRVYGRKLATLRFSQSWLDDDQHGQRQTVAHELIHAHLRGLEDTLVSAKPALGGPLSDLLHDAFTDQLELAVDALAYAVAPALPLPQEVA